MNKLLELALGNIDDVEQGHTKTSFVPMMGGQPMPPDPAAAGAMPPGDPMAAGGMPPMPPDPAMAGMPPAAGAPPMGGAMPMDPAAAGMPPDPMMGGAADPMMAGGDPMAGGGDPMAMLHDMIIDSVRQVVGEMGLGDKSEGKSEDGESREKKDTPAKRLDKIESVLAQLGIPLDAAEMNANDPESAAGFSSGSGKPADGADTMSLDEQLSAASGPLSPAAGPAMAGLVGTPTGTTMGTLNKAGATKPALASLLGRLRN